jgi:phosphodiesterase/alkaline phosphatase D-like protein
MLGRSFGPAALGVLAVAGTLVLVTRTGAGVEGKGTAPEAITDPQAAKKASMLAEQASRMRAAGEHEHARLAEEAAAEWRVIDKDLALATQAETRAAATRLMAMDAGAEAERERLLLEEKLAHNAILMAEYEGVERPQKEPKTARMDGGAGAAAKEGGR